MKTLFQFIFSRAFLINGVLAVVVLVAIVFGLFALMSSYTQHGQEQPVPDLVGMELPDAKELIAEQNLRIVVEDSTWLPDAKPGLILAQLPTAEYMPSDSTGMKSRMVKENRKIYVTMASYLPPQIEFPDLIGKSKRIALSLLEISGIKVEAVEYVPDNVCTDCVLKQLYKGKEIVPGTRIFKGESVTLVLGKRGMTLQAPAQESQSLEYTYSSLLTLAQQSGAASTSL